MSTKTTQESLSLGGLRLGSPQVLGGVRLVPILRDGAPGDLRLSRRAYGEDLAITLLDNKTAYYSYVPHALVATWTDDGSPAAAYGTQISGKMSGRNTDGKTYNWGVMTARVLKKMRAREDKNRLRFLPLDMSMEGFLSYQFGGPSVAWEEYSREALKSGLSPRSESTVLGEYIVGLEDALRVFEIHENQVGMLVFVADALASAFVVPHPADYLRLHRTLVTDFYGELIYHYGFIAQENVVHPDPIDESKISSLDDLRGELIRLRRDWSSLHEMMSHQLFDQTVDTQLSYKAGPFQMRQFMTSLDPKRENHIGEFIARDDGTIEYLKTYRLSAAQCRRAYLLKQLAASDWNLESCAKVFDCTKNQLALRLQNAGFGYLLHQHVMDAARAEARKK